MAEKFQFICKTPVTIDWLKENLLEKCAPNSKSVELKSWDAKLIGEGKGFVSFVIRVCLEWSQKVNWLPDSVVVKSPTGQKIEELMEGSEAKFDLGQHVPQLHNAECTFYRMWDSENPPMKIPRHYFSQEILSGQFGCLVFEDLTDCTQVLLGKGINLTQAFQLAESLANWHAWCLQNPEKWHGKFKPFPEEMFEQVAPMIPTIYADLKKDFPEYFDPIIDSISYIGTVIEDSKYFLSVHKEFDMPPVLVHGDFWSGNVMWDKIKLKNGEEVASDKLRAIYDWQTIHPGCPTLDFGRILLLSMNGTLRRDNQEKILCHYFEKLKSNLGKDPPFTYDVLVKSYYRLMKAHLLGSIGVFWFCLKPGSEEVFGGEQYKPEMLKRCQMIMEDTIATL